MAKLSIIFRNIKRIKAVNAVKAARDALRKTVKTTLGEEQDQAVLKLNKQKRNRSPVRLRNRCRQCGRPRGTLRKFGICRICLRFAAMRGDVPGLKKSSS